MLSFCMLRITVANIYAVWAAVGPLVGVALGAWLSSRWQRKKWILDNKTAEYRGILDALNSYRSALIEYCALYKIGLVAVPAQKMHDDLVALAKALDAVTNAFADRIFTRQAIAESGARNDWSAFGEKLHSDKSDLDELVKLVNNIHGKLVKASQDDLKLHGA
jgi:hypothetical protein